MNNLEKNITKNVLILGLCFIIGLSIVSYTMFQIKTIDNTLSVTGSAKQTVMSDKVKWSASFTRNVYASQLKEGYSQMKNDETIVAKFFKDNGITDEELVISPVSMQKQYVYEKTGAPDEYDLVQNVSISSNDILKIKNLSKNIETIINQGVIYSAYSPEYYYTKLPEMRVSLLPEAMKDAQERAKSIAESTGKKVGSLKSASMGVVQVMQPNSIEISDYGNYDLSTVEKEVMITVKASFILK
ncbi:MAG: SIMPL domain-containing protein [Candidatus Pacebacteria bacterium]|nr:SIMPL domain-containing protein [Candidatus Paceibacterota bacterium]